MKPDFLTSATSQKFTTARSFHTASAESDRAAMRRALGNWRTLQDSMSTTLRSQIDPNMSSRSFDLMTIGAAGRCSADLCVAAALVDFFAEQRQSWTAGRDTRDDDMRSYKNSEPAPPILVGSPPPPEMRPPQIDWDRAPWNRKTFQRVREIVPTAAIRRAAVTSPCLLYTSPSPRD